MVIEARDAVDGQFTMDSTHDDVSHADRSIVLPLTGPVRIEGTEPGDQLVVEILDVITGTFGYTAQIPGFGFLRDEFPDPYLARWELADGVATSPDLPGVRIPASPFMGTMGVAPSRPLLERITEREHELAEQGEDIALPDPNGAVPDDPRIAAEGLRTRPPRENGGNLDVRQMGVGSRILFPVWVEGTLFSVGDGHFAQGDGESCGTAIETRATVHVRLDVVKGGARSRGTHNVMFFGERTAGTDPSGAFVATTGLSIDATSGGRAEDLNGAARNALHRMIEHLVREYGYSRQQAYAICSVAVDLKVSEIVDAPNFVVTAFLPLAALGVTAEPMSRAMDRAMDREGER